MASSITECEYEQQASGIAHEAWDIWKRVENDIANGLFDRDPDARAQAESLSRDAQTLYGDLVPF